MAGSDRIALWGGHECTVSRIGDIYSDQTRRSGHHDRLSDLARFAELGITALRYPVLWERTPASTSGERDFGWADARLGELRRLGIRPIIGLIHHGSGPAHVDLLDPGFAPGLAAHARVVAERFPWVADWTPVNEPLTTARFACLYGHWYPHRRDEGSLWRALLNQIDATRLAMREIRRVNPAARLIQTDDLGTAFATPEMAGQAEYENQRRWLTWDLLAGRVTPDHPLWQRIASHGLTGRLSVIAADPCPADVIGINHYICSDRFLTHEFSRHPGIGPASDGATCINIEAVRTVDREGNTISALLREAAARYGAAIAVTECHNGSSRDEQMRWFFQVWRAAEAVKADGIDLEAVTAWSLLGAYDWNSLLTRCNGQYEPGVFDARRDPPRPTAMTRLLPALVRGGPVPLAHIVEGKGWWQRDDRLFPDYRPARGGDEPAAGAPILITGSTGTLARALARACVRRGLAYIATGRAMLALDDPGSVGRALDRYRPWAVVNCAGIVSIDGAEDNPLLCARINAEGAETVARHCAERGIAVVQISSDQVFGGDKGAACVESDPVRPLNAYGRSKADAERRVAEVHPSALIIRTAAFFSPDDRYNFAVDTVNRLTDGATIRAASDQLVSPAYVPDLVDALLDLTIDGETGVWHLANDGGASWADLARMVARACGLDATRVIGVPTAALGLAAARPFDVRLASERGRILPSLGSAMARFAQAAAPCPMAYAMAAE